MPISMLFTGRQWDGEGVTMGVSKVAQEIVAEKGWGKERLVEDRLELLQ